MKKIILFLVFFGIAVTLTVFSFNYYNLSKQLSGVVKYDNRNIGIDMRAHYGSYIFPSILVLDIQNISGEISAADVFRVFLQFANRIQDMQFDKVELASNGNTKFILKGDYFKQLGIEHGEQNPVYTMRTFPENVYTPDGKKAFDSWTGGLLGVIGKQMEEFNEFHNKWYIEDLGK